MEILGLFIILAIVLLAPFLNKKIEEELEIFLFVMGCLAVTITSQWHMHLVKEALLEPIKISLAVLFAGLLFNFFSNSLHRSVNKIVDIIGIKMFAFLLIVVLGLCSSLITAIIAALILVEVITCLSLERKLEIQLVVLSCFSIGLGAVLTPIGEPLSTIATAKLKGAPYYADFFFLFKHLWPFIIPGVLAFGIIAMILMPDKKVKGAGLKAKEKESNKAVYVRTGKVYLFVMALIFLGSGFKPIIDTYISKIQPSVLYWLNSISAVLDNATLAAAEIGPSMSLFQIKSALLGLLIAGGMLIPGNIPNIISAGKLKIKSKEWALFGVPLGIAAMLIYFVVIFAIPSFK